PGRLSSSRLSGQRHRNRALPPTKTIEEARLYAECDVLIAWAFCGWSRGRTAGAALDIAIRLGGSGLSPAAPAHWLRAGVLILLRAPAHGARSEPAVFQPDVLGRIRFPCLSPCQRENCRPPWSRARNP